ncbi:diacylglycerol kinase family protein [Streptomyces sp. GZWMJZ-114]|uniref:diacylglycerol/lipid kinase family protein n=1 Tax=unclassified Streptomyces TaxID=2593676 RepID=UPI00240E5406|nr:diacylglycerol kinase family protein [Streptomyces sp. GZWMJZ-114]
MVVNQHSGASVPGLGASADRIRDLLPLAEIVEPGPHDDLTATLDQAATQAAGQGAALGVCGGDGTANAAASSARRAGVALAVFPGGTHNHFAKDLGNRTFDDTARAFENGQATPIDLAHAGHEVTFLNTASLGAYPELVRVRERWEKKIGKPAASVLALLRVLPNAQPLTVTVNGTPQRLWLLFAGNGTYVPEGITPHHRPHLDDNLIDLRLVTADKPLARTRLLLSTLLAAPRRSHVYRGLRAAQFDLSGVEDGTGMAYDGEQTKAPTRLRLSKTASAVLAYAPAERE